jgi:hypothetical protein
MSAHQCLRTDKREWQTATVRPSFGTETTARTESDFEKQQLKSEDIFYSPVKISPSSSGRWPIISGKWVINKSTFFIDC